MIQKWTHLLLRTLRTRSSLLQKQPQNARPHSFFVERGGLLASSNEQPPPVTLHVSGTTSTLPLLWVPCCCGSSVSLAPPIPHECLFPSLGWSTAWLTNERLWGPSIPLACPSSLETPLCYRFVNANERIAILILPIPPSSLMGGSSLQVLSLAH